MVKKILLGLLVALVIIQFFRPEKNVHPEASAMDNDITKVLAVPADVQGVLKTSCYDCHSNNTSYPWYASVQPVAWWLNHHVDEGKHEINFNEFASYRPRRQYHKLEEIIEQVKEDEMPLSSYTLIHKDAVLTAAQKQLVIDWATNSIAAMEAKYPADSLKKKK